MFSESKNNERSITDQTSIDPFRKECLRQHKAFKLELELIHQELIVSGHSPTEDNYGDDFQLPHSPYDKSTKKDEGEQDRAKKDNAKNDQLGVDRFHEECCRQHEAFKSELECIHQDLILYGHSPLMNDYGGDDDCYYYSD